MSWEVMEEVTGATGLHPPRHQRHHRLLHPHLHQLRRQLRHLPMGTAWVLEVPQAALVQPLRVAVAVSAECKRFRPGSGLLKCGYRRRAHPCASLFFAYQASATVRLVDTRGGVASVQRGCPRQWTRRY